MRDYVVLFRPIRDGFKTDPTEDELEIIREHYYFLLGLRQEGRLTVAGPTRDRSFGIAIFQAESDEHAQSTIDDDPAVVKGVFSAEIHSYKIAIPAE